MKINTKKCSCVERLQLYSDEVENQTKILAYAVGDSDTKYMNLLVTENETVCDKAIECMSRLKQFGETISVKKEKKAEAKENMVWIISLSYKNK